MLQFSCQIARPFAILMTMYFVVLEFILCFYSYCSSVGQLSSSVLQFPKKIYLESLCVAIILCIARIVCVFVDKTEVFSYLLQQGAYQNKCVEPQQPVFCSICCMYLQCIFTFDFHMRSIKQSNNEGGGRGLKSDVQRRKNKEYFI